VRMAVRTSAPSDANGRGRVVESDAGLCVADRHPSIRIQAA
jgi:hypothetical protein